MFPLPSHYLLLGYLALSSVAVPVHFAPGIPAIPSYNLLSLNEKACSYEWIWTWRDVKFIQNAGFQLSVSAEAARKCLWSWSVLEKKKLWGKYFSAFCTNTPDTRKGHNGSVHAHTHARAQHARAHTQQTICDAELHKGHLLWRNHWSPNALTKSINYSPTKKPISNKNRARSVVRVPPQLQQLRPQIIRCAVKERQ